VTAYDTPIIAFETEEEAELFVDGRTGREIMKLALNENSKDTVGRKLDRATSFLKNLFSEGDNR
jgi:hypothetical protein